MSTKALRRVVGSRVIALNVSYARLTGSLNSAAFLAQACYWQERMGWGRWWYKTRDDWEEETTLTRRNQEAARKTLKDLGILEEERRGLPAKLFYRINFDKLVEELERLPPSRAAADPPVGTDPPNRKGSSVPALQESTQESKPGEPPSGEAAPPGQAVDLETDPETDPTPPGRPRSRRGKTRTPPGDSGSSTAPPVQSDCTPPEKDLPTTDEDDEDGVFLADDEGEEDSSASGPSTQPRGSRAARVVSPGGAPGAGPVYMIWAEFWDLVEARWPVQRPRRIDGKTAGRLKRDLIGDYGQQRSVKLARLAVLDWEAIQEALWKATKRGTAPSLEDVIDLRHDLAPYLETGVTSNQHRVSQFKRRFLEAAKPLSPDHQPELEQGHAESASNPLRDALRRKRGGA